MPLMSRTLFVNEGHAFCPQLKNACSPTARCCTMNRKDRSLSLQNITKCFLLLIFSRHLPDNKMCKHNNGAAFSMHPISLHHCSNLNVLNLKLRDTQSLRFFEIRCVTNIPLTLLNIFPSFSLL